MVKKKPYIPARGDIVWLNFTPQAGHEQKAKRPALVISPIEYNQKVGLAIFCPIMKHKKGYPFEVEIQAKKIKGVVLSDHLKNLDWRVREIEFILKSPATVLQKVQENIELLIQ
jgi:mRNA interferase MazF